LLYGNGYWFSFNFADLKKGMELFLWISYTYSIKDTTGYGRYSPAVKYGVGVITLNDKKYALALDVL
jgi:hypothetical protein